MTKTKLFAAAAVLTGLIATPVLAKDTHKHVRKIHAQHMHAANADNGNYNNNRDTGFWPADVAGDVVGGAVGVAGAAVGTAGAIASAPFRGWDNDNDYADNGYNNGYGYANNSYAYDDNDGERFGANPGYNNNVAFGDVFNGDSNYAQRDSYARRNNFVCQPGTWFRGEDGSRHICQ
ncbi:MAG: hypothetical protein ABW213_10210 [Tardiphaga sp.]